jgi:hypothetical protein
MRRFLDPCVNAIVAFVDDRVEPLFCWIGDKRADLRETRWFVASGLLYGIGIVLAVLTLLVFAIPLAYHDRYIGYSSPDTFDVSLFEMTKMPVHDWQKDGF